MKRRNKKVERMIAEMHKDDPVDLEEVVEEVAGKVKKGMQVRLIAGGIVLGLCCIGVGGGYYMVKDYQNTKAEAMKTSEDAFEAIEGYNEARNDVYKLVDDLGVEIQVMMDFMRTHWGNVLYIASGYDEAKRVTYVTERYEGLVLEGYYDKVGTMKDMLDNSYRTLEKNEWYKNDNELRIAFGVLKDVHELFTEVYGCAIVKPDVDYRNYETQYYGLKEKIEERFSRWELIMPSFKEMPGELLVTIDGKTRYPKISPYHGNKNELVIQDLTYSLKAPDESEATEEVEDGQVVEEVKEVNTEQSDENIEESIETATPESDKQAE